MENFASIAAPLTKLTQKAAKFQWTDACERNFQLLKEKLITAPVLTLPEGLDGYVIYCDASGMGLGCFFKQKTAYVIDTCDWSSDVCSSDLSHLLANDDEETVHISANRRYVVFTTAGYTIMSRLIEGEFLNYHNVIPNGSRTSVVLDTKEFIETIERASLIITERLKNPLRISFTEGKVVVRCQTNLGRVVDEFNAQCEGDEVEIGFNNRYLLDALRNARTEQVKLEISGPLSPVKVLPTEGSDFLYLVLPVRFKND